MMRCWLFAGLLGVALWTGAESASGMQAANPSAPRPAVANAAPQNREAIRQTPLLMRPNRPGHFYGNTVRWIHKARTQRGS